MDEATFRRLSIRALQGVLAEPDYTGWRQALERNPAWARDFAELEQQYVRASRRLPAVPPPSAPVPRAQSRVLWTLGPLFAAVAALCGAFAVGKYLERTQPKPVPSRETELGARSDEAQTIPPSQTPQTQDNPVETEPEPQPATRPEATSPQPTTEPDPVPASPELPWHVVHATGELSARDRDDAPPRALQAGAQLGAQDRVTLARGSARLRSASMLATVSERAHLVLDGPDGLTLVRGRLALRVLRGGVLVRADESETALQPGEYVLTARTGVCELAVINGHANASLQSSTLAAAPGELIVLSRSLAVLPLDAPTLQNLRAEVDASMRVLLHWDFESGPGLCNLGNVIAGGHNSNHALQLDTTQAAAGAGGPEVLFSGEAGLRLRFWASTSAETIEVTARVQSTQGASRAAVRVPVPPGQGWRMIDIALDELAAGARRDQPGLVPGAEYSALQFRVPPSPGEVLRRSQLAIDGVQVYSID